MYNNQDRKKKINIKIIEQITDNELSYLINELKRINGFDFLVDSQFKINQNP